MSDGHQSEMRVEGLKFLILIVAFIAASTLLALRLPA